MKCCLFYLRTQLQLVTALNMIDANMQAEGDLVCILADRLINEETKKELEVLHIFSRVLLLPTSEPSLKKWVCNKELRKVYPLGQFFNPSQRGETFLEKHKHLFQEAISYIKSATDIYFHADEDSVLTLTQRNCKRHLLDEGTRSYTPSSLTCHPDALYLYDVNLCRKSNAMAVQLPKLSPARTVLLSWLNKIYPISQDLASDIFFDQPLGKRPFYPLTNLSARSRLECNKFISRIQILNDAKMRAPGELLIRMHPGTSKAQKNYLKVRFNTMQSRTPFELEILNSKTPRYNLSTIYSSGACHWMLMLSQEFIASIDYKINIYLPKYTSISGDKIDRSVFSYFFELSKRHNTIEMIYPSNQILTL